MQSLLRGDLLLVVTFDNRIVEDRRFVTLFGDMMDSREQVLRVDSKHGIGERSKLAERPPGRDVVLQQEAGMAVQIEQERAVLAGLGRLGREQWCEQIARLLPFVEPDQHFGLIAAGTIHPLDIQRELLGRRWRICFRSRGESDDRLPKSLSGRSELLVRGGSMLSGLGRLGDSQRQGFVTESSVSQPEVVQRQRSVGEFLHAHDRRQRFNGDLVVLLRGLQQAEGQAVPRERHVLLIRVRLQVLAIPLDCGGELLFVVGFVGGVDDLRRHLLRLQSRLTPRGRMRDNHQQSRCDSPTAGPRTRRGDPITHGCSPR